MAAEWDVVPFGDAIDFQEGPGILAKDFRAFGVPLVRLAGLEPGGSILNGCNYLDAEMVERRWAHFRLAEGDVLLSTSASLGRVAVVSKHGIGAIPYTGLIRMRPRNGMVLAPFIRYLLRSPHFIEQVTAVAGGGSVINHFGPTHLREMTLELPPKPVQKRLLSVLSVLDDKIDLCRDMTRTLENMGAALFASWVSESEEAVSAKRAGDLEDAGILEIGDGYRAKNSELTLTGAGLPFARAGNLNGGFHFEGAERLRQELVPRAGTKVSRAWDAVFTSKGTVGRIAQVLPSTLEFVYSPQLCFWRSLKPDALHPQILLEWLRSREFRDQADAVKGQTDMADYVSLRDQRDFEVSLPWAAEQRQLGGSLATLRDQVDVNSSHGRTLCELRDALIPGLLSGEVELRELEAQGGRAA